MKNIMIIATTIAVMTGCGVAASKTMHPASKAKGDTMTVLEKGVKRKVIGQGNSSHNKQRKSKTSNTKNGVLVAFKNTSLLSVSEFEARYGLKLKSKMAIGYYVFENRSSKGDAQIIADIIANESNVKTVKPNWKLRNKIR